MVKKEWGPNQTVWKLYTAGAPAQLAVVALTRKYSWLNDMKRHREDMIFAGQWYARITAVQGDHGIRLRLL